MENISRKLISGELFLAFGAVHVYEIFASVGITEITFLKRVRVGGSLVRMLFISACRNMCLFSHGCGSSLLSFVDRAAEQASASP